MPSTSDAVASATTSSLVVTKFNAPFSPICKLTLLLVNSVKYGLSFEVLTATAFSVLLRTTTLELSEGTTLEPRVITPSS